MPAQMGRRIRPHPMPPSDAMTATGSDIGTESRLLVRRDGTYHRLGKVTFTRNDASIYVHPTATSGPYYFGVETVPEGGPHTFRFDTQHETPRPPHLSIHQSGRVHVRDTTGELTAGVQLPPLADYRGAHIVSLVTDSFDALPVTPVPPRPGRDTVADARPHFTGARLLLYVNGLEPVFDCDPEPQVVFELNRESLGGQPLYLGLQLVSQEGLGDDSDGLPHGVTLIAGAGNTPEIVFLRCQGA